MSKNNQKGGINNNLSKNTKQNNQQENTNSNSNNNPNNNVISTPELDLNKDNKVSSKVETTGEVPSARFGHTLTMVSQNKIILFGGAVGDTKNFVFSNETFSLNLSNKIWNKLESKNNYFIFVFNIFFYN